MRFYMALIFLIVLIELSYGFYVYGSVTHAQCRQDLHAVWIAPWGTFCVERPLP